MIQKTALVVGATGVTGRATVGQLLAAGDWEVIGLCRRPPADSAGVKYLAVDLLDRDKSQAQLGDVNSVTHLFYGGFVDRPTMAELVAPNLAMLANAVEGIEAVGSTLERVVLVEGTKWYGAHLGPFKTPAKEDDPRCLPPMFYHDQEDYLAARVAGGAPWSWSALRPQTICGFSLHSPMNLMMVIAVYASVCKALGLPLRFPGKPGAYRAVYQVCDSEHLARAMAWAAESPNAANQGFNITNGDFFRWENLWPRIAGFFEMEVGPVNHISLTTMMADKGALWQELAAQHGLAPHDYAELAAWPFGDYVFASEWDVMSSTTKIRQAGFHDVLDSEEMFLRLFGRLRADRVIP